MITMYGIKNCDTVKKARALLAERGVDYRFHDYKSEGLDLVTLQTWVDALGWEILLNTRGTTWRGLPESEKADVDEAKAVALMLAHTSLVKRPVLDTGTRLHVGFDANTYLELGS